MYVIGMTVRFGTDALLVLRDKFNIMSFSTDLCKLERRKSNVEDGACVLFFVIDTV